MWQGMPVRTPWPDPHGLAVGAVHGGQAPVWHVCHAGWGWPQGRAMEQGRLQGGGCAPHGTGGAMDAAPHVHDSGTREAWPHGGHGPAGISSI
jgi:hypothetical protein